MKRSLTLVSALVANIFLSATSSAQLSDALMLTVSSGAYSDQTAIRFLDVATNYFDSEWDAYKLENGGNTPNFCSDINNQTYSINALEGSSTDINQDLTLKLEVSFSGTYTITAEQIGLFDSTCAITLVDHFSGTILDLKANTTYSFDSRVGDPVDRFTVSFKVDSKISFVTAVNQNKGTQAVKIYNNQGTIIVEIGSTPSSSQIMVRDLSGNSVVQSAMGSSATETWNYTPQENGIYIVSLIADGTMYTEKLYVQR